MAAPRTFLQVPPAPQAAPWPLHSLLWEELLGFPMYLRMGLRFLSSIVSLSFFVPLLC